ncbi:MAG: protein kinase family protein [Gammaproteobacteria bacterium]|jgi:serine/threonine protein kinase|nr:protein kinase family protein [Gammaproteobacteria bacterium]
MPLELLLASESRVVSSLIGWPQCSLEAIALAKKLTATEMNISAEKIKILPPQIQNIINLRKHLNALPESIKANLENYYKMQTALKEIRQQDYPANGKFTTMTIPNTRPNLLNPAKEEKSGPDDKVPINPEQKIVLMNKDGKITPIYLCKQLGVGGYGAVYKAYDLNTGLEAAVKVCRIPLDEDDKVQAFETEKTASVKLNNKNELFTFAEIPTPDKPNEKTGIMVIPFAVGETLHDALYAKREEAGQSIYSRNQISELDKMRIQFGLINQLLHIHGHGILHLDLKDENAMYDKETGKLTLFDYGVSHITDRNSLSDAPIEGFSEGTHMIVPPEGNSKIGTFTDNYALGILLSELHGQFDKQKFIKESNIKFDFRFNREIRNQLALSIDRVVPADGSTRVSRTLRNAISTFEQDPDNENIISLIQENDNSKQAFLELKAAIDQSGHTIPMSDTQKAAINAALDKMKANLGHIKGLDKEDVVFMLDRLHLACEPVTNALLGREQIELISDLMSTDYRKRPNSAVVLGSLKDAAIKYAIANPQISHDATMRYLSKNPAADSEQIHLNIADNLKLSKITDRLNALYNSRPAVIAMNPTLDERLIFLSATLNDRHLDKPLTQKQIDTIASQIIKVEDELKGTPREMDIAALLTELVQLPITPSIKSAYDAQRKQIVEAARAPNPEVVNPALATTMGPAIARERRKSMSITGAQLVQHKEAIAATPAPSSPDVHLKTEDAHKSSKRLSGFFSAFKRDSTPLRETITSTTKAAEHTATNPTDTPPTKFKNS